MAKTKPAYQESEDHVPDPRHQYGTYDTSGTAGTAHARLEEVTPIFDVARAQDLQTAARALDPDDSEVPEHLVTLPQGTTLIQVDPEAVKERVKAAAKEAADNPVSPGGPTAAQQEAAQEAGEHKASARSTRATSSS